MECFATKRADIKEETDKNALYPPFFVAPNKNRKLTHFGCFVSIYYLASRKRVFGCYIKHPKRRFYL